jgi:vancomycin permeability regulator SanA
VVLGYGPPVDEQGAPKPELVRRVEKGVELYKAGLAPHMIMTGGNTYEDYFEARVMKDVAVKMAVPEDDIFLELEAMTTIGNSRGSAGIMKEKGWGSAIIVSSPYHLKRALHLFSANEEFQFQTAGCKTPDNHAYAMTFTLYEVLARIPYLFFNERQRAKAGWSER